ncbi:MAG: tRNA dihydrouridine synthase DusB [Candidatus Nanohalarchaeota archaeon]|nr:MAG: tRNA dihydrouridine synthase DusB [Candidatus Nanohaloarchaeota archaeon]
MTAVCIGNVKIKNPFILAPMANFTDLPFRLQCRKYGASLAFTEMMDADGLFHGTYDIEKEFPKAKKDHPVAAQIVGPNPDTMAFSAKLLEKQGADIIDINIGCPSFKLSKKGAGAKLLEDRKRISQIIKVVVGGVKIPVTVKIRAGWDDSKDAVKIAKVVETAGAAAITIHARTGKMGFRGKADWAIIKKIKKAVHIPVIGNGDVTSPKLALEMIEQTGCDLVMIGRAATGNPFIFRECLHYAKYNKFLTSPTSREKRDALLELWNISKKYYEPEFSRFKLYSYGYTKTIPGGKAFRERISQTKNLEELEELINGWFVETDKV